MKVQNAVVGMEVQVKHDCRGCCREFIKEGLVCSIKWIDEEHAEGYELSLVHPDIDDGYAWVNASDVRKYIKPTKSPFDVAPVVEPDEPLTKGTKVQVKSTLVGKWGEKLHEGDVYILQSDEDISFDGAHRRINVKAVAGSSSWSTQPKYFDVLPDEVPEEPKTLTLQDIQVGDWVVCSDDRYGLTMGVAYEVLRVHSDDGLYVSNPECASWATGFATRTHQFNKVLREVNDAMSRSY